MFFLADFSVIKPDPGLIIWTTIIFAIFWGLMAKFAFRPIANALKKRESDISDALNQAEEARQMMAEMKASNEDLLAEAREERTAILREAKDMKESIISEAKEKAKEEARKIVVSAKQEIENQKLAAVTELKNQAGMLAIEIAERVIKKELKGDAEQEAFVNSLVNEIKLN